MDRLNTDDNFPVPPVMSLATTSRAPGASPRPVHQNTENWTSGTSCGPQCNATGHVP